MSVSRRRLLGAGVTAVAAVLGDAARPFGALAGLASRARMPPKRRPGSAGTGMSAQGIESFLDELVPRVLAEESIPGASVTVVKGERSVFGRAYGLKTTRPEEPASLSTIFEAASLSKPVFAYVVLRMAERGEIDLDKPLSDYMPEPYIANEPRVEQVTARLVLSHRTGFPNWARNQPLGFVRDPGTEFGYSGEGFVYLQRVIEHLANAPLQEIMERRLFAPLGMAASSYVWRPDYDQRSAVGHNRGGTQIDKNRPTSANAAASLHTTAADFGLFLRAVLDRGDAASVAARLEEWRLSSAGVEAMLAPETDVDAAVAWGLGWGLEKPVRTQTFWHWGDNGAFKAFVFGSRAADLAVVMFTNGAHGLKLAPPVIDELFPGAHPALGFRMINY